MIDRTTDADMAAAGRAIDLAWEQHCDDLRPPELSAELREEIEHLRREMIAASWTYATHTGEPYTPLDVQIYWKTQTPT